MNGNSESQIAKALRRQEQPARWELKRMCGDELNETARTQGVCSFHLGLLDVVGLM